MVGARAQEHCYRALMRLGGYGRARGLAELRRRAFFIPSPGAGNKLASARFGSAWNR